MSAEPQGELFAPGAHQTSWPTLEHSARWASDFARVAAVLSIVVGCTVLMGWVLDEPLLKGAIGVPITMKANPAVCFVLAGAALWLRLGSGRHSDLAASVLALIVALIGGLTLTEHLFGVNLGIDELLFTEPPHEVATASPGRMGPPASTSFLIVGVALLLMDWRTRRGAYPFRSLPLVSSAISLISIVGYIYSSPLLYAESRVTGIAWPTAVAALVLSFGVIAARPEGGLMRVLAAANAGGVAIRQLLLPALLIPFFVMLAYGLGREEQILDAASGRGVVAVVMMIALAGVVIFTAYRLAVTAEVGARAQRELRSAATDQRRLSAIVKSSNDAILSKDLNGVLTSWNRAAERLFGYSAEEMVGQSIMKLIPAERFDEEREILARLRRGEEIPPFESVRLAKGGVPIEVSITISPILGMDGRVEGASTSARDITDRKRIEAEREVLLQSERAARGQAERAARLRDEFLAVVSHELRTPLNGILGWAHYLKGAKLDDKSLFEGVEAIERGARAQSQLVNDLLDMNRITTGRLSLDVAPIGLRAVVEAAIATVQPAAASKGIRIRAMLGDPADVLGDAVRLQQVMWNLLSNAVKFTGKGGRVDVTLRRSGSQVEIAVSDNGQGIEPEFLPFVFDRFRQADSSTTRAHGGVGLGLSIAKQLVELHGGTIVADSDGKDLGASFTVRLPNAAVRVDRRELAEATAQPPINVDLNNVTVLAVDDDPETRHLVGRVLGQCGATVETAASAAEALETLTARKVDVLVSDIGMPQMDGYAFIRAVRERLGIDSAAVPAIAVTAYARSEDRTRAMLAGYQMHIAKPIEPRELLATVASFAGRVSDTSET